MRKTVPLLVLVLLFPRAVDGQEPPRAPPNVDFATDFDRALDAVRRGEIRPLAEILPEIERRFGGRAIETEIETDHGRWVYEVEILGADGQLFEVDVDAVTGEIIDVEQEVD